MINVTEKKYICSDFNANHNHWDFLKEFMSKILLNFKFISKITIKENISCPILAEKRILHGIMVV